MVLGGIYVHYDDGTTERATLFLPWGTWIYEERNYRKSDLSLLMNEVKRVLESTRPTAPVLKDTRYWRLLDR